MPLPLDPPHRSLAVLHPSALAMRFICDRIWVCLCVFTENKTSKKWSRLVLGLSACERARHSAGARLRSVGRLSNSAHSSSTTTPICLLAQPSRVLQYTRISIITPERVPVALVACWFDLARSGRDSSSDLTSARPRRLPPPTGRPRTPWPFSNPQPKHTTRRKVATSHRRRESGECMLLIRDGKVWEGHPG